MKLNEFVESEGKRIEEDKKKFREEKGYKEAYKFETGENWVDIMPDVEPREKENELSGKMQVIFRVKTKDGEEKDMYITKRNPLYPHIIRKLRKKEYKMTIIKTGKEKSTRFELKEDNQ